MISRRLIPASAKRRSAQTTLELSFILLPFIAILFAIIDYSQIYFFENALQNGMRECCRFESAGDVIAQLDTSGNPETYEIDGVNLPKPIKNGGGSASRYYCARLWFLSNCVLSISITNVVIQSEVPITNADQQVVIPPLDSSGNLEMATVDGVTYPVPGPGNASQFAQVTGTAPVTTVTPLFIMFGGKTQNANGVYYVRVSSVVKNEPGVNFLTPATNSADLLP